MSNPSAVGATENRFLNIADLARKSNESEAVWRKRIFRKEIPYVKFGRNVRVSRESLAEFISNSTVPARNREAK